MRPVVEGLVAQASTPCEPPAARTSAQRSEHQSGSIPKLRKLLKIGASIFEYPGLIARGYAAYDRREYDKRGGAYTLWISASFSGREGGSLPYEFRLTFDDRGRITALEDVVYK